MDMHESIKKYGYTCPSQIDNDLRDICRELPTVSNERSIMYGSLIHSITVRPEVQYSMRQALEVLDVEDIATVLIHKYGWCITSWVRIQMLYMVTQWPIQYITKTKKIIVDYERFWADAWAADNIEELYETDY